MSRLLIVHEKRIPISLRKLAVQEAKKRRFLVKVSFYKDSLSSIAKKLNWADVALFAPGRYLDENILKHASRCKLFQLWSSGFDKFNVMAAQKFGIPVSTNGGANADAVAEHTILLMLAVLKKIILNHKRTVNGKWKNNGHGMDLFSAKDKTLGLVGFGEIGSRVGKIAAAMGMKVIYTDPNPRQENLNRVPSAKGVKLDQLLRKADIISLHVHLNLYTKGMISKSRLSLLKKQSILINVSRAELVDTKKLFKMLNSGDLFGVGLDVFNEEPTKPGDPLLNHPNVVCSPHMAAVTFDSHKNVIKNCFDNLERAIQGHKVLWKVA